MNEGMKLMQDGRKVGGKRTQKGRNERRKEGRTKKTRNTKKGSEESKARKQSKRIQQAEDSLNGLKLTVRVLVSAF